MDFAINKNNFGGGKDHQIIISTRLQKEALKPTNYGSFSSSTMDILVLRLLNLHLFCIVLKQQVNKCHTHTHIYIYTVLFILPLHVK